MPRRAALLLGTLLLGACSHPKPITHADRLRERPLKGTSILLVDPDVRLYEKTSAGEYEFKVAWTMAAERSILQALVEQLNGRRMDLVPYEMPQRGSERERGDLQVLKLHAAVSQAIVAHHFSPEGRLPSWEGRFGWTLGPGVRNFKAMRNVDYVLLVCIRDSYSSKGRGFAGVLGSELKPTPGELWGFVSLVEKDSGDIVWCNRLIGPVGDLQEAEPARQAVRALLERFPL
jgi:hypothetical protein